MIGFAHTLVTVYRGQEVDEWGDPRESMAILDTHVLCSITETNVNTRPPSTTTPHSVRTYIGRCTAGTDIRNGDILRDENTDETFMVLSTSQLRNPVMAQDLKLELQRVT
jgi:hypothetical protein